MYDLTVGLLGVLFAALTGTLFVAVRRRFVAAVVNASVSVVVAVLGIAVATGAGPGWSGDAAPGLAVWVTTAGLLHSVGMLGPYDSVWWWDHLTHTVSATLVGALLYAALIVAGGVGPIPALSGPGVVAVTVLGTIALGLFWELLEVVARAVGERYDVEPLLVVYGWKDTALDVVFDAVGGVLVVALDLRLFVSIVSRDPDLAASLLVWTAGIVTLASLVILAVVDVRPAAGHAGEEGD